MDGQTSHQLDIVRVNKDQKKVVVIDGSGAKGQLHQEGIWEVGEVPRAEEEIRESKSQSGPLGCSDSKAGRVASFIEMRRNCFVCLLYLVDKARNQKMVILILP